ncbi:MAG: DoxX family membrane protein [Propionibacteriales bacterium]|nr:DoxX family membrane protein [Propionibacteriales bacterium]
MLPWTAVLARLIVGGVWVYAGALKVGDPESSVAAVRAYQLLPTGLADTVGRVLPMLELVIGVCLVLGLLTRVLGGVSAVLQIAFIIGIASVWARGIEINCGCFGDGGPNPDASSQYPWEIARDLGLLALSVFLVVRPSSPYSVDRVLFPDLPEVRDVPAEP